VTGVRPFRLAVLFSPLLLAFPAICAAAEPPAPPDLTTLLRAEYRFLTLGLTNLPLDETGTRLGQKLWTEQRLRILGEIDLPKKSLHVELGLDAFDGLLAGDTSKVGDDRLLYPRDHLDSFRRYEPRRAFVAWRTPVGELRVGHQTSNWGLGILANSGERDLEFDDPRLGDLVERIAFATMPVKNLFTAVAFDLVYRDANASLVDGDVGMNAIASVFYRTPESFFGFYGVFRHQVDRDDERVNVGVVDLAGDIRRKAASFEWDLGFEGFLQFGTTNRLRPDAQPQGIDVLQGGAVVRGTVANQTFGFTLEVGVASGDNDRSDGTARAATFHPDYRVGMVLFPEVLAALTARASDRVSDPSRVGTPAAGTENLPTNGGVQNAIYLWPRIFYRPIPRLTLRVGLLYARALADVVDPFTSFRAGGVNRNFFDAPAAGHELGFEVQAGIRYTQPIVGKLAVHLGLEWGHLFPGDAFNDALGGRMVDVDRVIGRVILEWRHP
jgi:hypothetical protein